MSKGNLFLGFGRGKVGDVVFSHVNGEQVARARNRSPRNPQTPLQLLQRVVMKTASLGFSTLQDICNHSFQGRNGTTENQARFIERNIAIFRNQLAEEINSGDPETILTSAQSNFSAKGDAMAAMNAYQVSEGSLRPIGLHWVEDAGTSDANFVLLEGLTGDIRTWTYTQLCNKLNLMQGDQLTLLSLFCDDTEAGASSTFNGFEYSRFILEPDDGDMSHEISDITHLNPRNQGIFEWGMCQQANNKVALYAMGYDFNSYAAGGSRTLAAQAMIVSREVGGVWARSTEFLAIRPDTTGGVAHLTWDHHEALLSDAIASYMTDTSSLLYLNQAEV